MLHARVRQRLSRRNGPSNRMAPTSGGLRVGLTTFSTRELTLDQTIALLKQTGVRNIALKYFHLPLDSTKEERRLTIRMIHDAGLTLAGCGVIGLSGDERSVRDRLDYVQDIGSPSVTVDNDCRAA